MKILVTGAGGFIGSFLVKELIERGYNVRGLFLPDEDATEAQKIGVEIIRGDLTRPKTLTGLTEGVSIVFHLAAKVADWGSMKSFRQVTVEGTENLLEELENELDRFVYFSSMAALGFGRDTVGLDETAERKKCGIPYCDTKIEAEDLVTGFCQDKGIPFIIIRPANVIGPGSVWVKDVLNAFYRRGPVPLVEGGRCPGAFVYVTNLVDGVLAAMELETAVNRVYHFRDDYSITWGEYIRVLGSWLGKKPKGNLSVGWAWRIGYVLELILSPLGIRPMITRLAAGIIGRDNDVDTTRARTELGWKSNTSLEEAMEEIEKWVKEVYLR